MTIVHAPYLFGRFWDLLIAIGLGTISYYIYEKRHRSSNNKNQILLLTKPSKNKNNNHKRDH